MEIAYLILILSSVLFLISILLIWWIHEQWKIDVPLLDMKNEITDLPLISFIVPARNEARNIRSCVEALLHQDYPNLEVIVIDDRSTDGTGEILAEIAETDPRLTIIMGKELTKGWAGKPHALIQGAKLATGDWFCFVDADTFVYKGAAKTTLATVTHNHVDMFSILTRQRLVTFWERVALPVVFTGISVGFAPRRVNNPDRPEAIANGQYIFIRRKVYDAIGGHEAVKHSVVEDRDLAQIVKSAGYRLIVADGRTIAETRMYTNFAEIWEGWTKNIYLGMRRRKGMLVFGGVMTLVSVLLLPGWLIGGLLWLLSGGAVFAWVVFTQALVVWAYLLIVRGQAAAAFDVPVIYAVSFPLGMLVLGGMMFSSVYMVLSGRGVTWKGRTYASSKEE